MSIPVLLIEDDPGICQGLSSVFGVRGYALDVKNNGRSGLTQILTGKYRLVLLDVTLPDLDGFEILRQARASGCEVPVILLTARDTELDKVLGFDLGVDDYVTKPFSILELLGRVSALLRRVQPSGAAPVCLGSVTIDFKAYKIENPRRPVEVPPRAIELLAYLHRKKGQAVSRDELLDAIWGHDRLINQRTINNLVVALRQAIEVDPETPRYLKTVHGVGYRLEGCLKH